MIFYSFNIIIPNKKRTIKQKMRKNPLLAKIKFKSTFFQVLWRFAFSLPLQGEAGGRGVRGEFRPPSQSFAISVRIFSNRHRQLGNEVIGSPATRARQPFFGEISSRFEFSKARSGLFLNKIKKFVIIVLQ